MRRIITACLAIIAIGLATTFLYSSWSQPPPQTRLDLAQTNLALQATSALENPEFAELAEPLLGGEGTTAATQQYEKAISTAIARWIPNQPEPVARVQQQNLDELRLRAGILLANDDKLSEAEDYWQAVAAEPLLPVAQLVEELFGGSRTQLNVVAAQDAIEQHFDGWFRYVVLQRLYDAQPNGDGLAQLETQWAETSTDALQRLIVLAGTPLLGVLGGLVVLIAWLIGLWLKKWPALGERWTVPWDIETTVVVMSVWFIAYLLVGLFVPSIFSSLFGTSLRNSGYVQQAISLAGTYAAGAAIGFFLIFSTARSYLGRSSDAEELASKGDDASGATPGNDGAEIETNTDEITEGEPFFRAQWSERWPLWGLGGYVAALPLVVLSGIVAQWLLPQSGGGNPILPIILESQGWLPGAIFLVVVSVMAPLFEETLFRGFLLPSLTRMMPVWGAIAISSVLFAVVHLNVSDLLPLTTLGIVLGVVYSRSRNLLAPMLLHCCWNAGSFAALTLLSSGS